MITREDAVRIADEWINGGKNAASGSRIGIREFDLGFVVWAIDGPPEDLSIPPPPAGSAAGVIDKTTGRLTMMPGLPPDVIISRYRARCGPPGEHPDGEAGQMITREQAERLAGEIAGQRDGWVLAEFSQGWLVLLASAKNHTHRGGSTLVIEQSGRIMRFPSYVPPDPDHQRIRGRCGRRLSRDRARVVTTGKPAMMPGLPSDVIIARCRARQSASAADAGLGTC